MGIILTLIALARAEPVSDPGPTEPAAVPPDLVQVTVTSPRPGLTVAVTDHRTEEHCYTPCTFDVPRGIHEISTYGRGTRTVRYKQMFDGPPVSLESRPVGWAPFVGGAALSGYASVALLLGAAHLHAESLTCPYTGDCRYGFAAGATVSGAVAGAIGVPLMLHNGRIRPVGSR
jgi:hypothetical protein